MKVAGTVFVFLLALNRMGSHKSNSAIAGCLILRPNRSSTGVLLLVFKVLRCFISALCRNAPNDTLRLGHAWSARFTVWTALSASLLALGWWTGDSIFLNPSDSHHCLRSPLTNSRQVYGIPNLAKIWWRYTLTVSDVLFSAGKASSQPETASIIPMILPWSLK